MKTLDFKTAVEAVAVVAEKAGIVEKRRPVKPKSRDAAEELARRAEINARGAADRAGMGAALLGRSRGQWIEPRPDWLGRR